MRQKFTPAPWLILVLILTVFLVACERPLQDEADLTLESSTPGGEALPGGYPGLETPTTPGLLPTPTTALPGEGEQPPGGEPTDEAAGVEPTPSGPVVHTVVAGDTVGRLAEQYDVSIEDIAAANELADVNTLEVGQQLIIPVGGFVPEPEATEAPTGEETTGEEPAATTEPQPTAEPTPAEERVHVVNPGDTLFRIGQQYGFTIEELVAYNNLANPDRLEVGQQIRIPPEGYTIEP